MTDQDRGQEPPPRVMTLVYIKGEYGARMKPIFLVEDEKEADAITALIERSGAKVEIIDVPIWPDVKKEED